MIHAEYLSDSVRALMLLGMANFAPWMAAQVFGHRGAWPLDCGLDPGGRPLLGTHKTWRGLAAGVAASAPLGAFLGIPWAVGAGFAAVSLMGDALSSAVKRRLCLPPGAAAPGLDQLPEALLPMMVFASPLHLGASQIIVISLLFMVLNLLLARLRI